MTKETYDKKLAGRRKEQEIIDEIKEAKLRTAREKAEREKE